MKLLLHIGAAKAGSTTIQRALSENKASLREQGVLYWQAAGTKVPPPRVLSNLFEPARKPLLPKERLFFKTRDEARDWSRRNWNRMASDVREANPPLTVMSSESLMYQRPGAVLEELRKTFTDITILMYVRDPVQLYRSTIDQLIRDGAKLAELPLPETGALQAADRLQRYVGQLGADKVVLRRFDRGNFTGGDLVQDLFVQIGRVLGRPLAVPGPVPSENESLCAAATLWLLSLNETFNRFGGGNDADVIRQRLALIDRLGAAPELRKLPKLTDPDGAVADWIRAVNTEEIDWLNATAFDAQVPLARAPRGTKLPDEATQRDRLRDWLLSQARPEDLGTVLRTVLV